jgi:hypothetical protein
MQNFPINGNGPVKTHRQTCHEDSYYDVVLEKSGLLGGLPGKGEVLYGSQWVIYIIFLIYIMANLWHFPVVVILEMSEADERSHESSLMLIALGTSVTLKTLVTSTTFITSATLAISRISVASRISVGHLSHYRYQIHQEHRTSQGHWVLHWNPSHQGHCWKNS